MKPRLEVSSKSKISGELNVQNKTVEVRHDAGGAMSLKMADAKRLHTFLGKVIAYRPPSRAKSRLKGS